MTTAEAYWTKERIARLETMLARYEEDIFAQSFLHRLSAAQTLEEKQRLVADTIPVFLRQGELIKLWEGQEIPTRLAFRDVLLDYLHSEGVIQNVPTGESPSPDEQAERERLAQLFGQGERVSDILIEGRG